MVLNVNSLMLAIAALGFYALVVILAALRWKHADTNKINSVGTTLLPLWIALILHALFVQRLISIENGVYLGFTTSLTLSTWCIMLISAFITLHTRLLVLTVFMCVLSSLSIIVALTLPASPGTGEPLSFNLTAHITLSILSYSILSIAALIAILAGIQDHQLHHHHQSRIFNLLPPLQTMEKLMFQLIGMGFVLLSLAIASGFVFATNWLTHKIILSIIAWLVFLILLIGRYYFGWRGLKAIRWTLFGIGSLMLAFFGTKLILEFVHLH
jgi:ABC-type uncharacterized transport system permease subunit